MLARATSEEEARLDLERGMCACGYMARMCVTVRDDTESERLGLEWRYGRAQRGSQFRSLGLAETAAPHRAAGLTTRAGSQHWTRTTLVCAGWW